MRRKKGIVIRNVLSAMPSEKINVLFIIKNLSAIILGFIALSYIYGFIYLKYYLEEFGAGWILYDFNPFVSFNINWALAYDVLFFIAIIIGNHDSTREYPRLTLNLLLYVFVFHNTIIDLISMIYPFDKAVHIGIARGILLLIALISSLHLLALRNNNNFKLNVPIFGMFCMILYYPFFAIPHDQAIENAHIDILLQNSKLSIVKCKNDLNSDSNRLLLEMNDKFYIAKLDSTRKHPQIRVLDKDDIEYIYTKSQD